MLKYFIKLGISFAILLSTLNLTYAQCSSWEGHPKGVKMAKEEHVIYTNFLGQEKFEEAFLLWEKLFKVVQVPTIVRQGKEKKLSTHFQDGIQMHLHFAEETTDATKKQEHINQIIELYDQMATCLGEKSDNRAYEGYNLYYLEYDSKKVIEFFEKSMELGGNKTMSMVLSPTAILTVYLFRVNESLAEDKKDPKFTAEYMQKLYTTLQKIADYNIANNAKEAAEYKTEWASVKEEFDKIGAKIWGCDFHVSKLRPKFEADKMNMVQNAEILKQLRKKCGKEDKLYQEVNAIYKPYKDSVDYELAKKNFEGLCNLKKGQFRKMESRKFKKAGDLTNATSYEKEANEWFEKSLADASTDDCPVTNTEKGELAYRIAYQYYKKGNFSKARSLCRKAASFKSGWGEPYMLIGTMYASSGKRCSGGKGTGWDAQVVAWAAMDMWVKAKKIDPNVASKANSSIAKYRKYLPTKEDIFQRNLKEGSSYKVGCWIGVTTTIRAGGS